MYVKRQIDLEASQSRNGQGVVLKRGGVQIRFDAVADLNEGGLQKVVVPLPVTDKDLMEGQEITTGRILYLETDTEMVVKLDDTEDTGVTIMPVVDDSADSKPGTLYLEGSFSHVYVTPVGTTGSATVIVGILGA
jgi:hypothetical protein